MRIKKYSRYELKFVISHAQRRQLVAILPDYLALDRKGDAEGRYDIASLYFDSPDYQAYWDKVEGHRFRRKVRIRVYGQKPVTAETACFVEIKQRINKTLQKKRVILPYAAATALCGAGEVGSTTTDMPDRDRQVINEIQYLHQTMQLQPACVVSYNRQAFEGSQYDPSLRVTFDTNLKGRTHDLTLLSQGYAAGNFFLPPEYCVMEVKVNYRVPYWLTEIIGRHQCTLRRVSKYCTALEQSKAVLQRQQILS